LIAVTVWGVPASFLWGYVKRCSGLEENKHTYHRGPETERWSRGREFVSKTDIETVKSAVFFLG